MSAVCGCAPRECDAIAIRPEDTVVHEFDPKRLCGFLADRLSLTASAETVTGEGSTWSAGTRMAEPGGRNVFLLIGGTPAVVANGLSHLLTSFRAPWTALIPTFRSLSVAQREMVLQHGSSLLALEDLIGADGSGDLVCTNNPLTPGTPAPRQAEGNLFRREQDIWLLSFGGQTVRFRHLAGFEYIAELLRRPGSEIEALILAGRAEPDSGAVVSSGIDAADERSLRQVRQALAERRQELAGLREKEWPRRGALQSEIAQLDAYLSQAAGKHARSRKVAGSVQRARSAVAHAIARAIERIGRDHSGLAEHLRNSIRSGNTFLYLPAKPVDWRF